MSLILRVYSNLFKYNINNVSKLWLLYNSGLLAGAIQQQNYEQHSKTLSIAIICAFWVLFWYLKFLSSNVTGY